MAEDVLIGGKKLSELKVTELKSELDKRGLQKAGVKSVLMDRLRRAVLREGNSDLAAVNYEGDEVNVEELSDGENSGEREDPGEQSSTKKTPRSLRNTPGGDRTGSADPAAEDGGSDPEAEAPVPPLEVTMETNDPANDSEQHKNRGRSRKQQASRDASLVETPRSGTKDESRSPSQQTSERSDQDINSQEAGERVKRGPGRPRKNPPKDSPLPATPKSAVKATDSSSKKVVGSARRKSAPPTKMPVVKADTTQSDSSSSPHPGSEARPAASKPIAKAEASEGPTGAVAASQPRSRSQEVDFKKDIMSEDFAEKAGGESEDNDDVLLDELEEAPVPEYDLDRSAKAILDVPMEIASPIESEEEELLLDTSDEFGGRRGKAERDDASGCDAKLPEDDSDTRGEELGDSARAGNGQRQGHLSHSLDRNESTSSVQIDPSYQPDTEELLYEGDVETEARLAKAESAQDEEGDTRDDCFVFDVTAENMELDDHPSEKPKKDGGQEAAEASGHSSAVSSTTPVQSIASGGQERPLQCNLWLSGLANTVSAFDLQTLFSTVGQVISAKVVARAQSKHHRFGYVTMATPEQASLCIAKLNDTELKGRRITVELSKTSQPTSLKQQLPQGGAVSQGGQSSGQSRGVEGGGEKAVQEMPSTEAGSKSASSKRLMVVDKGDGKKILRVNRKESQDSPSRLPLGHSRERRRSSPHQRPPIIRKGSPRRPRSPPGGGRVVSRLDPRKGEPARRLAGQPPPPYRQVEQHRSSMNVRLEERRLVDDRRQEMMVRRQLEIEHSRREQEMLRRMQETHERETRERAIRERELAEVERRFQERERELREKEARERQRREVLERELRDRDARERELREKERRLKEMREQHEKELREREMKLQREMEREKEARDRIQAEKERQLKEQERKLREEKDKLEKERMERERRERERRAEEERRLREEQRLREERAKEEQERKQREEKERLERERIERERREHAEQEQRKRAGGREQKTEREQPLPPQPVRQQSKPAVQAQSTPQTQRTSQQTISQTQRPPSSQPTPQAQRPPSSQPTPSQAQRPSSSQPTPQAQRPPSSQPTPQAQRPPSSQPTLPQPQRPSQPSQTQRPLQAPLQSQRPPPPQQRNSMKRPFSEDDGYDSSLKRPALHDVRGGDGGYSGSSSIFNRLEPANSSGGDRGGGVMMPAMRPDSMSTGYPQQLSGDLSYRLGQPTQGSGYLNHGGMMEASKGAYPASYGGGGGVGKPHMTQEQLYAVSEAMESIRNNSYNQAGRLSQGYMPVPPQMIGINYHHRSTGVPDMQSHSSSLGRQQMMSSGEMSKHKLPPENERYNKRPMDHRPPPPSGRQSASFNKRLA